MLWGASVGKLSLRSLGAVRGGHGKLSPGIFRQVGGERLLLLRLLLLLLRLPLSLRCGRRQAPCMIRGRRCQHFGQKFRPHGSNFQPARNSKRWRRTEGRISGPAQSPATPRPWDRHP